MQGYDYFCACKYMCRVYCVYLGGVEIMLSTWFKMILPSLHWPCETHRWWRHRHLSLLLGITLPRIHQYRGTILRYMQINNNVNSSSAVKVLCMWIEGCEFNEVLNGGTFDQLFQDETTPLLSSVTMSLPWERCKCKMVYLGKGVLIHTIGCYVSCDLLHLIP